MRGIAGFTTLGNARDGDQGVIRAMTPALAIIAAVLWIYWPVLHGGWLWDDDSAITDNPMMRSPTGLWSIWFEPGRQIDYYPIKSSVQWIQWHLWGMDTFGYHLTNVVLHMISSLLVWRLLSKLGLRLAWLGGLIFAVHPVQVESVAWISELKNTLSLPPFLLAMCAWIDYDDRRKAKDYFLAIVLFLVAMLCKLSVVLFPLVILLYAWWRRGRIRWNTLKISLPFFGAALLLGLVTIGSGIWEQRFIHVDPSATPVGGTVARVIAAGLSLAFYFSKSFLPVGLLPIYPKWPIDPSSPVQLLPWLVLGVAIYWCWTQRHTWGRHALLGLGFFLINLAPCPGLIPDPTTSMAFTWAADHFLYLPIIGLIGLVVAALGRMETELPALFRPCGIGLALAVAALLAWQSRGYAKLFINSETLWTYELESNPESYMAQNNLGYVLLQTGRVSEALEHFEQAVRLKPGYAEAHNNLGDALQQTGRTPEARDEFEQAVQLKPGYAEAHNNLGNILLQAGRLPEAMDQFEQALRLKPAYAPAFNNLGLVLLQQEQAAEAITQFEQALQIQPDYALAHYNLGNALEQTGKSSEAMEQFEQALRLKPDFAEAHNNLGSALLQAGRLSEAIEQFEQAVRIEPDYADAHFNLGCTLQQAGRVSDAMDQFEQVLRINPDDAAARDNLARLQALQNAAPAKN